MASAILGIWLFNQSRWKETPAYSYQHGIQEQWLIQQHLQTTILNLSGGRDLVQRQGMSQGNQFTDSQLLGHHEAQTAMVSLLPHKQMLIISSYGKSKSHATVKAKFAFHPVIRLPSLADMDAEEWCNVCRSVCKIQRYIAPHKSFNILPQGWRELVSVKYMGNESL